MCHKYLRAQYIRLAVQKKEYKRKKEEEEKLRVERQRQREEEARRRAELELKIQKEKQRVAQLITDAENRQKSNLIREFILAIEKEHSEGNCIYEPATDFKAWNQWARNQADRLDPLTSSPPSIIDEEANLNAEVSEKNIGPESFYHGFWNKDE